MKCRWGRTYLKKQKLSAVMRHKGVYLPMPRDFSGCTWGIAAPPDDGLNKDSRTWPCNFSGITTFNTARHMASSLPTKNPGQRD